MSLPALISAKLSLAAQKRAKRKAKAKRLKLRKPTLTALKKRLWGIISPMIRERYGPRCFTCDGIGTQTGHMFAMGRAHAVSAFMPANLRPQCFNCNHALNGNGAEYGQRYIRTYGQEAFDLVAIASRTQHKWTAPEVEMLIEAAKLGLDQYDFVYTEHFGIQGRKAA